MGITIITFWVNTLLFITIKFFVIAHINHHFCAIVGVFLFFFFFFVTGQDTKLTMNTLIVSIVENEPLTRLHTLVVQLGSDVRQLSLARIHIIHAYNVCQAFPRVK